MRHTGAVVDSNARIAFYREQANELRKLAERSTAPDARSEFISLAEQYEKLAARLEAKQAGR